MDHRGRPGADITGHENRDQLRLQGECLALDRLQRSRPTFCQASEGGLLADGNNGYYFQGFDSAISSRVRIGMPRPGATS